MLKEGRSAIRDVQLLSYGVAVFATVLSAAVSLSLRSLIEPTPNVLFLVAVMVSAWYGGFGPGLLSTVLSALAVNYFFVPPYYALELADGGSAFRVGVFFLVSLLISGLNESRWGAIRREQKLRSASEAAHIEAQAAKERLETLLSSINDGFYTLDRHWCYTYANDRYCEMAGLERNQLLGKNVWELFPAAVDTDFYSQLQRARTEQTPLQFEYLYAPWNRWYEHRVYPSPEGLTVFIAEITDRKQAEAALKQSESKFRRLVEVSMFGVAIGNFNGNILYANDSLLNMIGYSRQELEAGEIRWLELTPSEQLYLDWQAAAELRQRGVCKAFEKEYIHKDGHRVPILIGAALLGEPYADQEQIIGFYLDLTELKHSEATLRQSEERFRVSQDLSLDAFTIMDSVRDETGAIGDFVWTYVNPKAAEILQHPADDLIGKRLLDVLPGNKTVCELFERYVRVVETGEPHDIEIAYASDGITGWFRNMTVKLADGVAISFSDITARKQAEQEREHLLEREQTARVEAENDRRRLQEFFLKAPAMIAYVRGPQYTYEFANPTYLQVAGRSAEALIGQPLCNVFPEIANQGFLEILDHVYRTGIPYTGTETRALYDRQNDGTLHEAYFNFVYQPLWNVAGEVEGILMHAVDVTAQVEARRRTEELVDQLAAERSLLEAVLQQMPAGVVIAEYPTGKLILGNQQVEQIWRRPFFASAEVREYYRYQGFYPDGRPYAPEEWPIARSLATGEVVTQEEIRFLRGDGTYGIMEVNAAPVRNGQGQIVAGVVTFQDISDRKESEREREQLLAREQAAREQAEVANRIKDEFLAVLSHELRSPLNPILGWSRLLQTQKMDEVKTAQALATIERNAKLQTQLIEDLLDVSRILRGKLSLTVAPVYLTSIIAAAIETVRLAAEAKSIEIESHLDPAAALVMGDSTRLQQIVWNLLSNAVKFTPVGGRVEVKLERQAEGRQKGESQTGEASSSFAAITVSDTGKGISPDFLPYVFDYFRQEDSKITRKFGGLGLGLAIVRHITELHGGTVQAESLGEDQGATFTVRLPLMAVAAVSDQACATTTEAIDLSQLRILVVDDEQDMRDLMQVILEQQAAQVWVAASAAEALTLFDRQPPDLLISDIGMPHVDGYMLMQQIRQRSPDAGGLVPAIALTAYAGEVNQQQALQAGFQQHLAKPVDPSELIKIIAALVRRC